MATSQQHGHTPAHPSPEAHSLPRSGLAAQPADVAANALCTGVSVEIMGTELYDFEL